jgi:hypothetical protein
MLNGYSEQLEQLAVDNDCPEAEAYLSALEHEDESERVQAASKFVNYLVANEIVGHDERKDLLGDDGLTHDNPFEEQAEQAEQEIDGDDSLISVE